MPDVFLQLCLNGQKRHWNPNKELVLTLKS